jgi:hypothetical protein
MHVGIWLGFFFLCVFCVMLFVLLNKSSDSSVSDNPYEPKLFLRLRNNNTYFVDIRTYSSSEWHHGELPYVSHTYNWRQVEAGTSQEEADKVMADILEELRAEKALKESLEYKTVKTAKL